VRTVRYEIGESNGATVVSFEGSLTLKSGRKVRKILMDLMTRARRIVIDLSGVVEADTTLAANLAEAMHEAQARSVALVLRGVAPSVRRVLELSRLTEVLLEEPGAVRAC
jgi:anti-anti-sigma factor